MGKKADLKRRVDQSIEACRELLEPLAAALEGTPRIPRLGGQAYYNEQARYLADQVAPKLTQLREHFEALETAIWGLSEYVRKTKKNLFKQGASARALAWQEEAQDFCDELREALKATVMLHEGALQACAQTKEELQRLELV
jgi:hypothetical protein